MFVTKKKFNETIEKVETHAKDITRLEREVLNYDFYSKVPFVSRMSQNVKKINEHTDKLKALMKHLKLEFKEGQEYEIVPKSEN